VNGSVASPPPGEPIEVDSVSHRLGELDVLDRVGLTVEAGQSVAVVGPSGCGKSTLLSLICGLMEPDCGTIAVGGESDGDARLGRCALMPQRDLLLPWRSAIDNAALALVNAGSSRTAARDQAAPLFERFGLAGFERSRPSRLSGGMRQRVAFLRTLLAGKGVLLLDEPFASLDALTRDELQLWLRDALVRERRTAVLVTHDVDEALRTCRGIAVMSARPGRIVLHGETEQLDRATVLEALRG
jgi:ABC-type nitrate/sulfonate/bicarbonate transport system ATPase subunit